MAKQPDREILIKGRTDKETMEAPYQVELKQEKKKKERQISIDTD